MNKFLLLCAAAVCLSACDSDADKIGDADTVFNLLGKNDRIEIEAFDDPDVKGVSCYLSYAKKGGLKEIVNLEEDASDVSVSCAQTAAQIRFNENHVLQARQVFRRSANIAFKSTQIVRYYDAKRKVFSYLVYSDRIIEGSPKNSVSAVSCFSGSTVQAASAVQTADLGGSTYGNCIIANSK